MPTKPRQQPRLAISHKERMLICAALALMSEQSSRDQARLLGAGCISDSDQCARDRDETEALLNKITIAQSTAGHSGLFSS